MDGTPLRLVGLSHGVLLSGLDRVRKTKRVEYYVVVVAVVEGEARRYFLPFSWGSKPGDISNVESQLELALRSAFVPIEGGAPFELLEGLAENDQLQAARHAFRAVRDWALRYADRVIADLYAFAIRELFAAGTQTVFLILGPVTTKIAGRLGYLYLPPDVTIAIVHTDPQDLMTSILSKEAGLFDFDLLHLDEEDLAVASGELGPYPGSLDQAMLQTYFLRPPRVGARAPLPIRADILAQGITERALDEKRVLVRRVLGDSSRTQARPFKREVREDTIVLPSVVWDARDEAERFVGILDARLRNETKP
jgi:hypothetical protein